MIFLNGKLEWNEEAKKKAEILIEGFYRAGGRPTVKDWKNADGEEREIMVDVNRRLHLEAIVFESGELESFAREWVATLPKDDRERIVAELLTKAAAERKGKKK